MSQVISHAGAWGLPERQAGADWISMAMAAARRNRVNPKKLLGVNN